jgi:hypothetical protein
MRKVVFPLAMAVTVAILVLACLFAAVRQSQRSLEALFAINATEGSRSVIALLAIGLLTMALIQAARNLFPMRAWYHETKVRSWLGEGEVSSLHSRLQISKSPVAFYDLPIQSICGQIAAVGEAVLVEDVGSIPDKE